MAFQWYIKAIGADPNLPSSYSPVGSVPPECPGDSKICAIYADSSTTPNQPTIDSALQGQMTTALTDLEDQPRVLLRTNN